MPVFNNILAGASGSTGGAAADYKIERSLRFNRDDGAYLSRNFAAGNRKTWTWSGWVKLGREQTGGSSNRVILFECTDNFSASGNPYGILNIVSGMLGFGEATGGAYTTAQFRDHSAWYHIVAAMDTTQSTPANRLKLYVNGVQYAHSGYTLGHNSNTAINQAGIQHNIGREELSDQFLADYLLADVHFVDGQALDCTSFGGFDATTGVWNPIKYTGNYNYSSGTVYSASSSGMSDPELMFDGNTSTNPVSLTANGTVYTMLTGVSIPCSTSLRIHANANSLQVSVNGGAYTSATSVNSTWLSLSVPSGNTLTSLTFKDSAGGGYGVHALEVDGTVLVDGSAGANGFHLNFSDTSSNAALGTDSSGNNNTWTVNNLNAADVNGGAPTVTGSNIFPAENTAIANLWDGQTSSYPGDFLTAANGGIITVSWPTPLTNVTKIQYYSYNGNDRHEINNGGMSSNSGSGGGWKTAYDSSTPIALTSLALQKADGNSYVKIGGIKVNDVHLTTSNYSSPTSPSDSLLDSPSNYDDGTNIGGNYCTLNPLDNQQGNGTLSNGNLDITQNTTQWAFYRSTMFVSSGKWYWECTLGNNQYSTVGICTDAWSMGSATNAWANESNSMYGYYPYNGEKYNGDSGVSYATADTSAAGSVIGVALDMDNGTLTFYKDGTSLGTAYTGLTGKNVSPTHWLYNQSNADSYNFGQRPFKYAPGTTGAPAATFKALCTQNFADPLIANGSDYFDAVTYTSDGQASKKLTFGFSPDFFWSKVKNFAEHHVLHDSVRGPSKVLKSSSNAAETTESSGRGVLSFDSDGVTIGIGSAYNSSGNNSVVWAWDAGDDANPVSNTDGSITSSVRANQTAGFSIVGFTPTSTNQAIGHGLNVEPSMVIYKNRAGYHWRVYHSSIGTSKSLFLNTTDAATADNDRVTAITSSTFTVGSIAANDDHIAYCFAPVEGYSAFGSYTGNGSSDGPFVYTGFRPRWVLIKNASATNSWAILDTARDTFNGMDERLHPNSSGATNTGAGVVLDVLSNGFKCRNSDALENGSGNTIIYIAFAENPFKISRAR